MAQKTIVVKGLRELQRDLKRMSSDLNKEIDKEMREAAKIVSEEARSRLSAYSARSAMGIRPRLRGFGRAFAEQSRKKTTGKHPEWGAFQMRRAFLPALAAKQEEVIERVDDMLARLGGDYGF